jgi:uncharacterized membrane protein YphA (DoxX/SURF4 family)
MTRRKTAQRREFDARAVMVLTVRIPLAPPVFTHGTFFLLRSAAAGTPQNAGLSAHLPEPQGRAPKPILDYFLSLFGPFLQRNRTTAILVRMLEVR